MELTIKKKAFLEDLPGLVDDIVNEYGTLLKRIIIEEDEKGCYTLLISYETDLR